MSQTQQQDEQPINNNNTDENGIEMKCGECGITNEELTQKEDPNTSSRRTPKLRICSGCLSIYYCGAACQKKQWAQHKDFCNRKQEEREHNPYDPNPPRSTFQFC